MSPAKLASAAALVLALFAAPMRSVAQTAPAPATVDTAPPTVDAVPTPYVPPTTAPEPADDPGVRIEVTGEPGRGFTVDAGDPFAMTLRARAQIRNTLRVNGDQVDDNFEIKTARIWLTGHVLDPHVRYGLQLALGANDFEVGNPSPIFDAFFELTHLRDLNVRVGQFFVPFDRARTIREFALQTVDRTDVVRELTLDRDVGIVAQSPDLFGLDGMLTYNLGIFGGEGRNRLGATFNDVGFLYVGRVSFRPLGGFDDDQEGDLARRADPKIAVGAGAAYNQASERSRSTTGTRYLGGHFDYTHLAADLVFKWMGISVLSEIVYRGADRNSFTFENEDGETIVEYSRSGWGYLAQLGVMVHPMVELWGRWDQLVASRGATDPAFVAQANDFGHTVAGGLNVYVSGHFLKVQADWAHSFGDDFGTGFHLVRVQLDASF